MKRTWAGALIPALLGIVLAIALYRKWLGGLGDPIVFVRTDVGNVALVVGLGLSALVAARLAAAMRAERLVRQARKESQAQAAAERRRFMLRLEHELKNPLTAIQAGLANLAAWPGSSTDVARSQPIAKQAAGERAAGEQATGGQVGVGRAGGSQPVGEQADHGQAASEQAAGEREAIAQGVDTQVRRIGQLAADLRKLADLETRPLQPAPVDMSELLQEAVEVAREQAARQHGALEQGAGEQGVGEQAADGQAADGRSLTLSLPRAPWPLPPVAGDRDLLFLAVHNLLDNALKFSRPGDTVEVRGFEDRGDVVVEVADTGPGIPAGEVEQVWEELYRGRGAKGVPGSGLGLSLVRVIAERHAGQVALRSREGEGTVVTLRLPAWGGREACDMLRRCFAQVRRTGN